MLRSLGLARKDFIYITLGKGTRVPQRSLGRLAPDISRFWLRRNRGGVIPGTYPGAGLSAGPGW